MRFDDRFIDELKSRIRLSDLIGKSVKLRRQGREFVGLSPFNAEKSPSFFVNDDKQFYHDFSSGKHGDAITFVQETERLSFTEAVERLAAEAGLPLPAPDPEAKRREEVRQGLADWLDLANAWFQAQLRSPAGRVAREYLAGRGLSEADWTRFGLGYAPAGRTALKDYLITKGALPAQLIEAGLLIQPEDGASPYDRFRERIMFPITDARGRMVSFGGRALNPEARAKYLNGPDTSLFDKGRTLYGLPEARKLMHAGGEAAVLLVVEGYMDVIACQKVGVAAAAPMGTALTEAQMDLLWRLDDEPVLCFDGDRAGRAAAGRAIERALPRLAPGRSLRFMAVEGGKDPDEVIRTLGANAFRTQIGKARPFVEALFVRERDLTPLETPEQRADLRRRLRAEARKISDEALAGDYRDALMARLDALFKTTGPTPQAPRANRFSERLALPAKPETRQAARALTEAINPTAAALALLAVEHPDFIEDHLEATGESGFGDAALKPLSRAMVRIRLDCETLDSATLRHHLGQSGFAALLNDITLAASHAGAPLTRTDVSLASVKSQWSRVFEVVNRLAALEEALSAAKNQLAGGDSASPLLTLKKERDALKRSIKSGTVWTSEA